MVDFGEKYFKISNSDIDYKFSAVMDANGEVYDFFIDGYVNANEFKGFKSVAEAYELNIIIIKGELFF